MTDIGDTLASEAAQQIVQALVAGMIEAVKKIPRLWHRSGQGKEAQVEGEIERTLLVLRDPGNLPAAVSRQEGAWEVRIRDLLDEYPETATELRHILDELRKQAPSAEQLTQNITAHTGGTAAGAMHGNVIIHHGTAPKPSRPRPPSSGLGPEDWQGHP